MPFIYRGVEIRANTVASLPFSLSSGETEVWGHEADSVPEQYPWLADMYSLLWQVESGLCLVSEAFWFKEQNLAVLLDLRWMAQKTMTPKWDKQFGLTHFERRIGAIPIRLEVDEVVYFRLEGQHETKPRIAPAQAAANAAGVIYSVDQFVSGFFRPWRYQGVHFAGVNGCAKNRA